MPLGLVGPVALGVLLPVGGGEREAGDGHAAGGGTDLGIFADVAEKENFVDALCHVLLLRFIVVLKDEDSRYGTVERWPQISLAAAIADKLERCQEQCEEASRKAAHRQHQREPTEVGVRALATRRRRSC